MAVVYVGQTWKVPNGLVPAADTYRPIDTSTVGAIAAAVGMLASFRLLR